MLLKKQNKYLVYPLRACAVDDACPELEKIECFLKKQNKYLVYSLQACTVDDACPEFEKTECF
jgi:hypothetical protein